MIDSFQELQLEAKEAERRPFFPVVGRPERT